MHNDSLKIAFVDDHPLIMEGLKMLLNEEQDLNIVGLFVNGESFLSYLKYNEVNILLLDISLPDINGMDLCKTIKKQSPQTIVLILSNHTERSIIMQAIQNGANGYLLKNASTTELRDAIYKALEGNIVFSKEVNEIISRPAKNQLLDLPQLTKREKQILQLISEGKTSNQIAQELYLSALTVDTHRKNLMQKLEVKNAAELINEATKQKLLSSN